MLIVPSRRLLLPYRDRMMHANNAGGSAAAAGGGANPPPILTNLYGYWDIIDSVIDESTASGRAKQMTDLSGNSRHLSQTVAANQPVVSGKGTAAGYLLFDGVNYQMQALNWTSRPSPYTVYFIGSQETWTINRPIWSNSAGNGVLAQNTATPQVVLYAAAGTLAIPSAWPLATLDIITCVVNGASSAIRRRSDSATTGNAGTAALDVFNMGNYSTSRGNFKLKAALVYDVAHNTANQDSIIAWAQSKYSF